MGLLNTNKEVDKTQIGIYGTFKVKLALSAMPDIINSPKDIVLILDSSGSMRGEPLTALKKAVNQFIDIVDEATDANHNGQIGFGSKIAIVEFSTTAAVGCPFTTDVTKLKTTVEDMLAGGSTNHAKAFEKAFQLFDLQSTNEKLAIIFTDGGSNPGNEGFLEAQTMRNAGITIYAIGLNSDSPVKEDSLKNWASDPDSAFVLIAPNYQDLEKTFEKLAFNITKPGATDIVLTDRVNQCFNIISVDNPTKGNAFIVDDHNVKWTIPSLGNGDVAEGATLEFTVQQNGTCLGHMKVNHSNTYQDAEGNVINLPDPYIIVKDDITPVVVDDDKTVVDVMVDGCKDFVKVDAGEIEMNSLGRILQVDLTIKNVCPNKRVALGVIAYEIDDLNVEHMRGMKTMLVPAHAESGCRDVEVKCIKFVMPEELDATGDPKTICNTRLFRLEILTNYIDSDYISCT